MDKKVVTEIVSFDIEESITNEMFKEIVNRLEREFHMLQPGYIDSELLKGRSNAWSMIMHWESLEEVKLASKGLMKSEIAERFRQAIIPSSVTMNYLEQITSWSK